MGWEQVLKDSNAQLLSVHQCIFLNLHLKLIHCFMIQKITIKMFSICPSEICDKLTTSCLGWFNAARHLSITPENLIDSAKLYDYYVNSFNHPSKSVHTMQVHLSKSGASSHMPSAPATHSTPTLMGLVNAGNVEPQEVDISVLEEQWFNHPDLYDLLETEHMDEELQAMIIQSS